MRNPSPTPIPTPLLTRTAEADAVGSGSPKSVPKSCPLLPHIAALASVSPCRLGPAEDVDADKIWAAPALRQQQADEVVA